MLQSSYNSLVATLLAWYDLDSELNQEEISKFRNIGLEIRIAPTQWETTEKGLLKIIAKNTKLFQLFQHYKSCLEQKQINSWQFLLPSESALDLVAPRLSTNNLSRGGIPTGNSLEEKWSTEITNTFIRVALTPDPSVSIKNVEALKKLKQSVEFINTNTDCKC